MKRNIKYWTWIKENTELRREYIRGNKIQAQEMREMFWFTPLEMFENGLKEERLRRSDRIVTTSDYSIII